MVRANIKSTLYVSRAALGGLGAADDVDRIVAAGRERNHALQVSGALIFTGAHFAQILEGPPASVDLIMASIERDPRHHSIRRFDEPAPRRAFPEWSLVYKGPASFVDRRIRSLFASAEGTLDGASHDELTELMRALAEDPGA